MNSRRLTWARHVRRLPSGALIAILLLSGCSSSRDGAAARIQSGGDLLQSLAVQRFEQGWDGRHEGYYGAGVEWADEYVARAEDERFPAWAEGEYDLCVYWQRDLSYEAMNLNRRPGEPSRLTFYGRAWGWILLKAEGAHVLELGVAFDGQPYLFVDAWLRP